MTLIVFQPVSTGFALLDRGFQPRAGQRKQRRFVSQSGGLWLGSELKVAIVAFPNCSQPVPKRSSPILRSHAAPLQIRSATLYYGDSNKLVSAPRLMPHDTRNSEAQPITVFVSYSHKDEALREELDVHLANLKRQNKISAWNDRAIEAGTEWDAEIKAQLEAADVILLLISPRFMASDYCYDLEMQRAMERHDAGTARVIPIFLKPVDWKDSPFSKLNALPKDAKPITTWDDQDEAFLNVVQGIRRAVESLQVKK
jgi:hypothetical protein